MKRFYRIKRSLSTFCPQCHTLLCSERGCFSSKTFTCPICGVEVLRVR